MAEDAADEARENAEEGSGGDETGAEQNTHNGDNAPPAKEQEKEKGDHHAGMESSAGSAPGAGAHVEPEHYQIPPFRYWQGRAPCCGHRIALQGERKKEKRRGITGLIFLCGVVSAKKVK